MTIDHHFLHRNPTYIVQLNYSENGVRSVDFHYISFYPTTLEGNESCIGVWHIKKKETESRPNHKLPSEL